MVKGTITKYPNKMPIKKSPEIANTAPPACFLSLLLRAGDINFQNSQKTKGEAKMNPEIAETLIDAEN